MDINLLQILIEVEQGEFERNQQRRPMDRFEILQVLSEGLINTGFLGREDRKLILTAKGERVVSYAVKKAGEI